MTILVAYCMCIPQLTNKHAHLCYITCYNMPAYMLICPESQSVYSESVLFNPNSTNLSQGVVWPVQIQLQQVSNQRQSSGSWRLFVVVMGTLPGGEEVKEQQQQDCPYEDTTRSLDKDQAF